MKHVKKLIKLANLKPGSLNEEEQNVVFGGACYCGCYYADCGGSSSFYNDEANDASGKMSTTPGDGEWGYPAP